MRKIIHRYTVLLLTVLLVGTGIALADTDVVVLGDVNSDGSVNATDVTVLVNYLHGSGAVDVVAADVNRDGAIDIADVTAINNIISNGTFDKGTASTLFFPAATVNKSYGDAAFTNQLVRSGSTGAITYESSAEGVATVNTTTGEVTIQGAGTATITATLAANGGISGTTASYTVNVAKVAAGTDPSTTMTTAVSAKKDGDDNQSYTGVALELVNAGTSSAGTVYYKVTNTNEAPSKGEGWSSDVPTATGAGTYYVWYYAGGNENYNETAISGTSIEVVIDKAPSTTDPSTTMTTPVTAKKDGDDNQSYTGVALELVNAGTSSAGTVYYKVTNTNEAPSKGEGWSSDVPTATGAGTYYVWYYAGGNENYNETAISGTSIEVVIDKAPSTTDPSTTMTTAVSAKKDGENNQSYTGTALDLVNEGTSSAGTVYYKVTPTNEQPTSTEGFSASVPKAENAGTYYVWYYAGGNENYDQTAISGTSIEVVIDKATPTYTAPAFSALTYTGEAQNLVSAGISDHGTFTYSTTEDGTYTEAVPQGTAAGSYTVWYKFTGDANHNDVAAIEVTGISIAKAPSTTDPSTTMTTPVTAKKDGENNQSYTGGALPLVTAGVSSAGTVYYKVTPTNEKPTSTEGFSASVPTATDAGTYYVWYYAGGNDNYNETAISGTSIEVVIDKATPVYTAPAFSALTYTGGAQNLVSAGVSSHGTFTYSTSENGTYTEDVPQGTTAGSYTVWYKFTGDANHNDVPATEVTGISIAKAPSTTDPSTTMTTAVSAKKNGENNQSYTGGALDLVTAGVSSAGTVYYKVTNTNEAPSKGEGWSSDVPTATDAGTYYVWYYAGGNENYNQTAISSEPITVVIDKAPSTTDPSTTMTTPVTAKKDGDDNQSYTGVALELVNAGTSSAGTVYYKVTETNEQPTSTDGFSESVPTATGAGTYYVWYYAGGNENYDQTAISGTSIEVVIDKADITPSVTMSGWTYGEEASSPSVTGNTGNGSVTYQYKVSGADDGTYSESKPTTPGTYIVKATIAESANYNGNSATADFTITSGTLTVTAIDYSGAYDGTAHGITVTCEDATIKYGETEGTYDLDASPTLTNVGTKTVYYQVTKENYTTVEGSKTVTITAVAATVTTAPAAVSGDLTYTGGALTLFNAGSVTGGTLKYKVTTSSTKPGNTDGFTTTIGQQTDAGTYYLWYYVEGDANHNSTDINATGISKTILRSMSAATTDDIGKVICSNGHIHSNVSDVTCGGSASAMIAYVGNQNNANGNGAYNNTYNHGLAIALADVINTSGDLQASDFVDYLNCEKAKTACSSFKGSKPSGVTWMLPSAYQWERMLIGCGSTATYVAYSSQSFPTSFNGFPYGNFRTKLTSCGNKTQGVYDVQSGNYWSSTERSSSTNDAWGYDFSNSRFVFPNLIYTVNLHVRACYAF